MKTLIAAVAGATILLSVGAAQAKDWTTVRIATEGDYMPWNGSDANKNLIGFEVDLSKVLCAHMKVKCQLIATDWDGIIPALKAGKFDAIMDGMSITADRKKVISFSVPYAIDPTVLAAMQGSPLLKAKLPKSIDMATMNAATKKELAELGAVLKGKTIGVQVSTIQQDFLQKTFGNSVTVRAYDKIDQVSADLAAGRIDAMMTDRSVAEDAIKAPSGKGITLFGPLLTHGLIGEGVAVGMRQSDQDLAKKFDAAIAAADKDGTIAKLSTKWFGYSVAPKKM